MVWYLYEVRNNHVQQQFVYFIVAVCLNTLKRFVKSVSIRKSNLKFCTVTSTEETHQIPKNQNSVTESLK